MDHQEALEREPDFKQAIEDDIKAADRLARFRTFTRRQALKLAAVTAVGLPLFGAGRPVDSKENGEEWPQFRLSQEQQDKLTYASYFYTAGKTQAGTVPELMTRVSFIQQEDLVKPDILSGPIAISVLDKAGLLKSPKKVDPVEFKTLRPDKDKNRFDEIFPSSSYFKFETSTPAADFDWKAHSLLPGDFMYLRPGGKQDLHQFIAVTRLWYDVPITVTPVVDAYWGYEIGEYKIYDAQDPASGLLKLWLNPEVKKTDPYNGVVGQTGNGGFKLWRVRA